MVADQIGMATSSVIRVGTAVIAAMILATTASFITAASWWLSPKLRLRRSGAEPEANLAQRAARRAMLQGGLRLRDLSGKQRRRASVRESLLGTCEPHAAPFADL